MDKKVRVRFAPSPTGPLHMGGVRTALYNYLFAKKHGGDFILRIEDTDQTRYVEGAEEYIAEALEWAGMSPMEGVGKGGEYGPYRQSERRAIYKEHIERMLADGTAYYAFDTPEELDAIRKSYEAEKRTFAYNASARKTLNNSLNLSKEEVEAKLAADTPYTVRIKTPENETVAFKDIVRDSVSFDSNTLDDKILYKSDGLPTYHFANVVDDHMMKISHVIRGEEWLPSTPCHVLLYRYLGWEDEMPTFAHLPLILKPNGKGKLSKRDGDAGGFPVFPIDWQAPDGGDVSGGYREGGYSKDAFVNMLAFLGWNPGTEQEIFSMDELIEAFSLERIGKAGAKFDPDKTKWFNQEYLKASTNEDLASIIAGDHPDMDAGTLAAICGQMKERVTFAKDISEQGAYFFTAPTEYDAKMVKKKWKETSPAVVNGLVDVFNAVDSWDAETLETAFKGHLEANEIGFGLGMISTRLVLTGKGGGPSLFDIMQIIGKEESITRMKTGVTNLTKETV